MNDENAHWVVIHASRASNDDTDLSAQSASTTLEYEQYFSYNVKKPYPFNMSYSEENGVQKYFTDPEK
jgi:predicted phosphatase